MWEKEGPSLSGSLLRQWVTPRAKRSEAGGGVLGQEGSFGQKELKVPVEIQDIVDLMCVELSKGTLGGINTVQHQSQGPISPPHSSHPRDYSVGLCHLPEGMGRGWGGSCSDRSSLLGQTVSRGHVLQLPLSAFSSPTCGASRAPRCWDIIQMWAFLCRSCQNVFGVGL